MISVPHIAHLHIATSSFWSFTRGEAAISGLTIAFRDRDTMLNRGGRYDLDHRHQIETPSVGEARGRTCLCDARPRNFRRPGLRGSGRGRLISPELEPRILSRPRSGLWLAIWPAILWSGILWSAILWRLLLWPGLLSP